MHSSLQNINKQTMESRCGHTDREANVQALAIDVYLLGATFSKRHLIKPVPSGGLWLCRAGGHLPDTTPGGVGGGRKGGGRGLGRIGRGTGRGRTTGDKCTAPLDIRAVPGALIKLRGAISKRKQGASRQLRREIFLSPEEEVSADSSDPIILAAEPGCHIK